MGEVECLTTNRPTPSVGTRIAFRPQRVARVVETHLEIRRGGNLTGGSNPSSSASLRSLGASDGTASHAATKPNASDSRAVTCSLRRDLRPLAERRSRALDMSLNAYLEALLEMDLRNPHDGLILWARPESKLRAKL